MSAYLIAHPTQAAALSALLANLLVALCLYGYSATSSRHLERVIAWWTRTFTDPYPQTPATIAAAKLAAAEELRAHYRALDETPCYRGLGEIQKATRDNLRQFQRRRELDATVDTVPTLTRPRIH